jgi:GTP-binding protein HflX
MATYPTSVDRPKAVVFAVLRGGRANVEAGEDALAEIKELLASADIEYLGEIIQRRDHPDAHSYLGPGKLTELAAAIGELGANVAVCEDDLSPAQVGALLDAVGVDVLDRTELILTVFSKHAHSLEGTLQVHLAQLEYELTRMRGKGLVLSRLGAGVDMRGPGETKLEVDRRVIRKRIQVAGYTNAGKSTLLNALTDADVSVRDRLFETLDPTTRGFRHCDRDYLVTDTVGFIRKLPHELVDAFASTLEETRIADVVLVVEDAHLEPAEVVARHAAVADVLDMIGSTAPRITILNKCDLVDAPGLARMRALQPEAIVLSAARGEGLDDLRDRLAAFFAHSLRPVRLLIPYAKAGVIARLRGVAADIVQESTAQGIVVTARLPEADAARFEAYAIADDEPKAEPAIAEHDAEAE